MWNGKQHWIAQEAFESGLYDRTGIPEDGEDK
jgi:hypothetical protein